MGAWLQPFVKLNVRRNGGLMRASFYKLVREASAANHGDGLFSSQPPGTAGQDLDTAAAGPIACSAACHLHPVDEDRADGFGAIVIGVGADRLDAQ